jgi:formylglycine-generating enzyme required for sulfatase activity
LGRDPEPLEALLRADPSAAARLARDRAERGLLLLVDPLDPLVAVPTGGPSASSDEREPCLRALHAFGELSARVRAVFTLRADRLPRLTASGELGNELLSAVQILAVPSERELRDVIVGPARTRGFELEPASSVGALVAEVVGSPQEALPLLSFAMAETWKDRDEAERQVPMAALARAGGVAAVLARHGELVLASLEPRARKEAQRILVALAAQSDGAAARRGALVAEGDAAASEGALTALAGARLIVVREEACALAHPGLVRAWPRLGAWLDEHSSVRAARQRLRAAAREWDRGGRRRDLLWTRGQLLGARKDGALDDARGVVRDFVRASRTVAGARFWGLRLGVPVAALVIAAATWGLLAHRRHATVAAVVAEARTLAADAEQTAREVEARRASAFEQYDRDATTAGDELWKEVVAEELQLDQKRQAIGVLLDRALALDAADPRARALAADTTLARLVAAERMHHRSLADALRSRLDAYDDGSRTAWLTAPGQVRFDTDPPGASLVLSVYRDRGGGRLVESDQTKLEPGASRALPPGSYLVEASSPERYPTRYPFTVERGEARALHIVLPRAADVPPRMIYVPAGRFFYGSRQDEATRSALTHQPMRAVDLPAFLVARLETTWGEYLRYLRAASPEERAAHLPSTLVFAPGGAAIWTYQETEALREGTPVCAHGRPCIDWTELSVDGVSPDDGTAFASWLSRTGQVPRARLCTDREWERAARGADDRQYPWGNSSPAPEDACANFRDVYYNKDACALGSHPAGRSVFGLEDVAGSTYEWTSGQADTAHPTWLVVRSSGYADGSPLLFIENRGIAPPLRSEQYGIRLCADAP